MNNKSEPLPGLRVRNLSRRYGNHVAVRGLDLDLRQGEVLGLLGPNGAGKSTTMQMLAGTLAPGGGSIEICGIDLMEHPAAAKVHLGYLPEIPPLYPELTVREFLRYAARLHQVPRGKLDGAIDRTLQQCALIEVGHRLIGRLSKGYRQRVGIAQALVHNPSVIILDEPTAGLDPLQRREMRTLIGELGRNRGVLLSTHSLTEAEALCGKVLILQQGGAVFCGQMEDLRNAHEGSMEDVFVQLTRQGDPA